MVIYNIFSRI